MQRVAGRVREAELHQARQQPRLGDALVQHHAARAHQLPGHVRHRQPVAAHRSLIRRSTPR